MKTKYLIIGQGLAGTLLHYQLKKSGEKSIVIDNNHSESSSAVAAGLINPVVFKRLNKSWMIDETLPILENLYSELEALLKTPILKNVEIHKSITSQDYIDLWNKKRNELSPYLGSISPTKSHASRFENEKIGSLSHAYVVATNTLIKAYKKHLLAQNEITTGSVDYSTIKSLNGSIELVVNDQKVEAQHLIFCEGAAIKNNPFFNWIPFKPCKGEILTVKTENELLKNPYNNGKIILPEEGNKLKICSTYEWEDLSHNTTDEAKEELIEKGFRKSFKEDYEVVNQVAGVRPSSNDRRPVLGTHPRLNNVHLFNGLGAKGALLAPYFSNQMAGYLSENNELSPSVNLERYIAKYFTQ